MSLTNELIAYLANDLVETKQTITPTTKLFDSGLLDSLLLVSLVSHLEKTYSIKVKPLELNPTNFATVSAIEAFIEKKRHG